MSEYKTFPISSFKALDGDAPGEVPAGVFEALVAVFNNIDRVGDRIVPGAFKDSLDKWSKRGRPIPVVYAHQWNDLDAHIGRVLEAEERDEGLWVKAQLDLDEPFAQRVFRKMKDGTLAEFSFAYEVKDAKRVNNVNELRAVDLLEVGPCLVGMNPETQLLDIKTAFAPHSTPVSTGAWDGPANERRVRSGESEAYYRRIYAYQDADGDPTVKTTYRFIHHEVSADGDPGAANVRACQTGIGVLNGGRGGTTIPDADREGVWRHLARHLRDADLEAPELRAFDAEAADDEGAGEGQAGAKTGEPSATEPSTLAAEVAEELLQVGVEKLAEGPQDTQIKTEEKKMAEAEQAAPVVQHVVSLDELLHAGKKTQAAPGSLGRRFTESADFQSWMKTVAPSGAIPARARGLMSPPMEFGILKEFFGAKDLVTGADDESAGAFVAPDYTGIYEPLGRDQRTLRTLVTVRQTTSDLVSFVRQTAGVAEATAVQEANVTTYSGATGEISGQKPEGALGFEEVQLPVQQIAVWVPATKRALSDVAQLRGIIDGEVREDVAEELESQMLNGSGAGGELTGLLNTTGVLTQAWDTDILTTCRRAITTLRTTGHAIPTAWLLNPEDWETIDLTVGDGGQYYFGGPVQQGTPTLWGYPVVQSAFVSAGTGILGDWRKAVLWMREEATIQISDSHSDFFIRNMVAILCELRAAFGLISPDSFITVDMSSGS